MKQESLKRDVWLSIHSTQQFIESDPEEVSLITDAKLYQRNGKLYIVYDESALTGMEGTRTTLKLDGKQATLIRAGAVSSELSFAEGECHVGLYHTGYGEPMTISTRTQLVRNTVTLDGGVLMLSYTIEIDNQAMGHHEFEMLVSTEPMV